jgi:AcrR family transcriptional regulator
MSISYEETGRRSQKARTRTALIAAARELLAGGRTPTVEEAAEASSISRATAYRYFSSQQDLLVAAHPEIDADSLLGPEPPEDPEARLDAVVTGLAEIFLRSEQSYRAMLRLSLEPESDDRGQLTLRKGLRFRWIEDALKPLHGRLREEELRRLVHAISTAAGIEALITLIDLAGLSRQDAVEVMRWSARSLLRAAVAEAETGS